ncbi:MAG: DUF1080 domain-containing protein [Planctomycetota bacterium]
MNRITYFSLVACLSVLALNSAFAAQSFTDPKLAEAVPSFSIQGEYIKDGEGLQIATLAGDFYLVNKMKGGLPGQSWDAKTNEISKLDGAAVKKLIEGYKRVTRESSTLGTKPPADAVVLFDGSNLDQWDATAKLDPKSTEKILSEGTRTKKSFKDFTMHLEFRMPYKPDAAIGGQDRGNSGVYIYDRYEVQVLDSFGLHYNDNTHALDAWKAAFKNDIGVAPSSDRTQWCGAMYHEKTPILNMAYPPLTWQTYDITFTAPKFVDGKKTTNARITVVQNGVKVQDDYELKKGTGAGGGKPEVPEGIIYLQGHGNPVRYRNIWIVAKN